MTQLFTLTIARGTILFICCSVQEVLTGEFLGRESINLSPGEMIEAHMTEQEVKQLAWDFAIKNKWRVAQIAGAKYVPAEERFDGKCGGLWFVRLRRSLVENLVTSNPFYCVIVEDQTGEATPFTWPSAI